MLPVLFLLAALVQNVTSQTFTSCNPLTASCPADPALGGTANIDFTKGASSDFTVTGGTPSYQSDGMHLTVAQRGDAPTLTSKWYIMFGHIDIKMKAAPGQGIISSVVLQSDDLDEIDLEWVGSDTTQVQSNYFGKGQTLTYDRGAYHNDPNANGLHTYSIDYTAEQIVWQVDGVTVRVLTPTSAESNQYPQTPMQLKIGIWSGGDPSNSPGTITWAGGLTNYAGGPYSMVVESVRAVDYSTGTSYSYSGNSGTWQSIHSNGGAINGAGGNAGSSAPASAPAVTEVSSGSPTPFDGTHRGSSSFSTPSEWPWVASSTVGGNEATQTAQYPDLPSGWTVSASGKVVPPSAACASEFFTRLKLDNTLPLYFFDPSTHQPTSSASSSPPVSSSVSSVSTLVPEPLPSTVATVPATITSVSISTPAPGTANSGSITTVVFNNQGFATTIVVPPGWTKQYDSQGFLILPTETEKGSVNAVVSTVPSPSGIPSRSTPALTGTETLSVNSDSSSLVASTATSTSISTSTDTVTSGSSTDVSTSLVTSLLTTTTVSVPASTVVVNAAPATNVYRGLGILTSLILSLLIMI